MVTGVSSSDKATYMASMVQKTNTQEQSLSTTSSNIIEDSYISFQDTIAGNTEAYYAENSHGGGAFRASSLSDFRGDLDIEIVLDYKKQHNVRGKEAWGATESYRNSIDYAKEYEEYKQARGCSTDEELSALNSTGYATREELVHRVKNQLESSNFQIELSSCGVDTRRGERFEGVFSTEESDTICSSTSIKDLVDYYNAGSRSENFKGQVDAFQSFIGKVAQNTDLDKALQDRLSNLSKQITNAADAIAEYSDKQEEEYMARHNMNKYNSSLISKYEG